MGTTHSANVLLVGDGRSGKTVMTQALAALLLRQPGPRVSREPSHPWLVSAAALSLPTRQVQLRAQGVLMEWRTAEAVNLPPELLDAGECSLVVVLFDRSSDSSLAMARRHVEDLCARWPKQSFYLCGNKIDLDAVRQATRDHLLATASLLKVLSENSVPTDEQKAAARQLPHVQLIKQCLRDGQAQFRGYSDCSVLAGVNLVAVWAEAAAVADQTAVYEQQAERAKRHVQRRRQSI